MIALLGRGPEVQGTREGVLRVGGVGEGMILGTVQILKMVRKMEGVMMITHGLRGIPLTILLLLMGDLQDLQDHLEVGATMGGRVMTPGDLVGHLAVQLQGILGRV